MARYDADGRRIRKVPAPTVDYKIDHDDAGQLLAQAHQQVHRIAHFASECMQDHVGEHHDEGVVRDMHDIIGAVAHLQSCLNLMERAIRSAEAEGRRVMAAVDWSRFLYCWICQVASGKPCEDSRSGKAKVTPCTGRRTRTSPDAEAAR